MPSRRLGGRDVSDAREVSDCLLLFDPSMFAPSCACSNAGFNSCIVAAILGTCSRFLRFVWLRGPLPKDHRSGKISLGMPPPRSEMRMITCCGASQMSTSMGGTATLGPECFSTTAWIEFRKSSPMMYCRCDRMYGNVAPR